MRTEELAVLPQRPVSEFEWEDLLLRVEVMPRALRVALEAIDPANAQLGMVLCELLRREYWVGRFIEAASLPEADAQPLSEGDQVPVSLEDTVDRFVRIRARNFAMLQRRGIEVWGWNAPLENGTSASVHQVLKALCQHDVAALEAVRELTSGAPIQC